MASCGDYLQHSTTSVSEISPDSLPLVQMPGRTGKKCDGPGCQSTPRSAVEVFTVTTVVRSTGPLIGFADDGLVIQPPSASGLAPLDSDSISSGPVVAIFRPPLVDLFRAANAAA